jgi:hypothetical protein
MKQASGRPGDIEDIAAIAAVAASERPDRDAE